MENSTSKTDQRSKPRKTSENTTLNEALRRASDISAHFNSISTYADQKSDQKGDKRRRAAQNGTSDALPLDNIAIFVATTAPDDSQPVKLHNTDSTLEYFALQSEARRLLFDVQLGKEKPPRVQQCLRVISPRKLGQGVDIMRSESRKRARYVNLMVCGRVWQCPICARRITEKKRQQLDQAVRNPEYKPFLITYTLRHNAGDSLAALVDDLLAALRWMKNHRAFKTVSEEYAFSTFVRSLECTHGNWIDNQNHNGWHPHCHELIFIPAGVAEYVNVDGLRGELFPVWQRALEKFGRSALEVAMDIQAGDQQIGDYVAKWGLSHEVAKGPVKKARLEGFTALQLLQLSWEGDQRAGQLYVEYNLAMHNRNQLRWGPGAKELLGVDADATDDELADSPLAEDEIQWAHLTDNQWNTVKAAKRIMARRDGKPFPVEIRALLIKIAHAGDQDTFWRLLHTIGVKDEQSIDATDLMWSEYEKQASGVSGRKKRQERG